MKINTKNTGLFILFMLIFILSIGCNNRNKEIEQKEMSYDTNNGKYMEVKEDTYYKGKETKFVQGKIIGIKKESDDLAIIILETDIIKLEMSINSHSYIGNYTKSPKKKLDYLNEGMNVDINYYEHDNTIDVVTLNVVE